MTPRMNMRTKCEEGMSMRSQVIYRKRKGYIQTDRQTDRHTDRPTDRPACAKQYALFDSKGGGQNYTIILDHNQS